MNLTGEDAKVVVRDTAATPCFALRTAAFLADIREAKALGLVMDQESLENFALRHDVPVMLLESENTPEGRAASKARITARNVVALSSKTARAEEAADEARARVGVEKFWANLHVEAAAMKKAKAAKAKADLEIVRAKAEAGDLAAVKLLPVDEQRDVHRMIALRAKGR